MVDIVLQAGVGVDLSLGEDTAAAQAAANRAEAVGRLSSANLFDPAAVTGGVSAVDGRECYGDGSIEPAANSYVSGNIPVYQAKSVAITGLGPNAGFARYVHFLQADGATIVAGTVTNIPDGVNEKTFAVPPGAHFMRFSPRQRVAGSSDFSAVSVKTGRVIAVFGDSVTETENVDAGQYVYGSGYRANWLDYVVPRVQPLSVHNFARSGGAFNDTPATANQRFSQQVTNCTSRGIAFDAIIIALGTNDWGNSATSGGGSVVLGTAAAALAKDYGSLDLSIAMDGMRQGLQRLRNSFPDATIFVLTPIQRGDFTYSAMRAWVDDMKVMAGAFGAELIDQFSESGIVYFFETVDGSGVDLTDRMHPRPSGMLKQSDLIAPRLARRLASAAVTA